MCNCKNVEVGSLDNQIEMFHEALGRKIWVDACIAEEVMELLNNGVKTMGCCCGHNKLIPSIAVHPESVKLMEAMGYKHHFNPSVPKGKYSRIYFYAKSIKCSWRIKLTQDWLPWLWFHFIKMPEP